MENTSNTGNSPLYENFEDFFEHTHIGYVISDKKGAIIRANSCIAQWLDMPKEKFVGRSFSDFLTIGGKLYHDTHLAPLLKLQGYVDEVALELVATDKHKIKVLVNAFEKRDLAGHPLFTRFTIIRAADRFIYEQNLRYEKILAETSLANEKELALIREQFIAVLGHDLRNPLSSIIMGNEILEQSLVNEEQMAIGSIIRRSTERMSELIANLMDFARVRMGNGIGLKLQTTDALNLLRHVVNELQQAFPERVITADFSNLTMLNCDGPRLSQLLSNLLANAITHGADSTPILVEAFVHDDRFELSVINGGIPIPLTSFGKLFQPFHRESNRPTQHGLGLGLYIAAEIARGHNGTLTVSSNEERTKFTLSMSTTGF